MGGAGGPKLDPGSTSGLSKGIPHCGAGPRKATVHLGGEREIRREQGPEGGGDRLTHMGLGTRPCLLSTQGPRL